MEELGARLPVPAAVDIAAYRIIQVGACGGTLVIDPRGFTVTATLPIG